MISSHPFAFISPHPPSPQRCAPRPCFTNGPLHSTAPTESWAPLHTCKQDVPNQARPVWQSYLSPLRPPSLFSSPLLHSSSCLACSCSRWTPSASARGYLAGAGSTACGKVWRSEKLVLCGLENIISAYMDQAEEDSVLSSWKGRTKSVNLLDMNTNEHKLMFLNVSCPWSILGKNISRKKKNL